MNKRTKTDRPAGIAERVRIDQEAELPSRETVPSGRRSGKSEVARLEREALIRSGYCVKIKHAPEGVSYSVSTETPYE